MPTSERDEREFARIVADLHDFAVKTESRIVKRHRWSRHLWLVGASFAMLLLPVAADTGWYPLGIVGFAAAAYSVQRWWADRYEHAKSAADTPSAPKGEEPSVPEVVRRLRIVLGVSFLALVLLMGFGPKGTAQTPAPETQLRTQPNHTADQPTSAARTAEGADRNNPHSFHRAQSLAHDGERGRTPDPRTAP